MKHVVNTDFEEKMKELTQDRFFTLTDEEAMREKLLQQRVTTYVLQRLQLGQNGADILYGQLYGDMDVQSPLLDEPPVSLVPLSLVRRRKTSSEEIESTLNSLKLDRKHIGEHLDIARSLTLSPQKTPQGKKSILIASFAAAERVSEVVHSAVQYMKEPQWYATLSAPKKRFIRAVRRVVRMNLVAKTKEVLRTRFKTEKGPLKNKRVREV